MKIKEENKFMSDKLVKYILIFISVLTVSFVYMGISVSAGSLYDADENSPWYADEITESESMTLPDYATNDEGDILINNDTALSEVLSPDSELSVSGSDIPISGSDSESNIPPGYVTYAEMENLITEAMAESKAANLSIADAYLSSAIVDVFSRVVAGYPVFYKYAAYRTNSSDSNEGYLIIGYSAKVNGNYLEFPTGSQLVHYYRVSYQQNYQTYWLYKYDVAEIYDTYRIPYRSGQLIYTNMVKGYPVLSEKSEINLASIVIPVFVAVICLFIIMRRKK